jgi:hypothetical protein
MFSIGSMRGYENDKFIDDLLPIGKSGLQTWRKTSSFRCQKELCIAMLSQQVAQRDIEAVMALDWC